DTRKRDFSQPDKLSDVCLLVGGENVHVSRTVLALHSPVFEAMFFRSFEEAGKSEVEIREVLHEVWTKKIFVRSLQRY
ncbi:hypothetical protein PENTCL1PPCAC_19917, partial [Pristionchus entomophagus]